MPCPYSLAAPAQVLIEPPSSAYRRAQAAARVACSLPSSRSPSPRSRSAHAPRQCPIYSSRPPCSASPRPPRPTGRDGLGSPSLACRSPPPRPSPTRPPRSSSPSSPPSPTCSSPRRRPSLSRSSKPSSSPSTTSTTSASTRPRRRPRRPPRRPRLPIAAPANGLAQHALAQRRPPSSSPSCTHGTPPAPPTPTYATALDPRAALPHPDKSCLARRFRVERGGARRPPPPPLPPPAPTRATSSYDDFVPASLGPLLRGDPISPGRADLGGGRTTSRDGNEAHRPVAADDDAAVDAAVHAPSDSAADGGADSAAVSTAGRMRGWRHRELHRAVRRRWLEPRARTTRRGPTRPALPPSAASMAGALTLRSATRHPHALRVAHLLPRCLPPPTSPLNSHPEPKPKPKLSRA